MSGSSVGFILLDSNMNPVASNPEALRILSFPTNPEHINRVDLFLRDKVRASLVSARRPSPVPTSSPSSFVPEFRSGNRRYLCTAFVLDRNSNGTASSSVVLLLERNAQSFVDMSRISAQFDLTPRERETVEHLVQGLTTKEIARRMNVSPSTVNAFLRMVMVKMGATTRSGVVGKVVRRNV